MQVNSTSQMYRVYNPTKKLNIVKGNTIEKYNVSTISLKAVLHCGCLEEPLIKSFYFDTQYL